MTDKQPLKTLQIGDTDYETRLTRKFERRRPYVPPDPRKILCIIPGVIQKIYVHPGKRVVRGEPLLVLEAMKMLNDILSPDEGRVKAIHVAIGEMVTKGTVLVEFE